MRIDLSGVSFHPMSFADEGARLFRWKGELLRAIDSENASFYRGLIERGIVDRLARKNLIVSTEITDYSAEGYPLIVRHREIAFVSYPYEWCWEMLRDAALCVVDLELELIENGLTLRDAHPWNVVFDGPRPVYVDLNSIMRDPKTSSWWAYHQFRSYFLNPLELATRFPSRFVRWILHDDLGVSDAEMSAVRGRRRSPIVSRESAWRRIRARIPGPVRTRLKGVVTKFRPEYVQSTYSAQERRRFLLKARKFVESLSVEPEQGEWSDYYGDSFPRFEASEEWTEKHHAVSRVLESLRPFSVLDAGSNRGWYSQLAARRGASVVAFDTDEAAITELYRQARRNGQAILPLVMDFRIPSPALGVNNMFESGASRLRCDLVLALALVHHLALKERLNFHQIASALANFSKRWLLVEFAPAEDRYVREWGPAPGWYRLDRLKESLGAYFSAIEEVRSDPAPRLLLLCTK